MIVSSAVEASLPLAEQYASNGLKLIAKPNTPLELLNSQVKIADSVYAQDEFNPEYLSAEVTIVTSGRTEGSNIIPSMHDIQIGNISEEISKYVLAHISFAKNSVKPIVVEYAESLKAILANTPEITAESSVTIEMYELPAILQDETFVDAFKYADGRTSLPPEKYLTFENRDHEALISLLMTGDSGYDKDILPWASKLDSRVLEGTWNSVFRGDVEANAITTNINFSIDRNLVIYLIASHLEANVENTAEGVSLDQYNTSLRQLKDMAATDLWASLKTMALYMDNETVVLNMDQYKKSITLFKPTYDKFLTDGGSPEAILGLLVSDGVPATKGSAILALAEKYAAKWETYRAYFNVTSSQNRMNAFKTAMEICFTQEMNKAAEAAAEFSGAHSEYSSRAAEEFKKYVESLDYDDINSVDKVALDVVGKCIFYYTDSFCILKNIEEAYRVNPNISVREAATMATIAYVTDYVLDQIKVVN